MLEVKSEWNRFKSDLGKANEFWMFGGEDTANAAEAQPVEQPRGPERHTGPVGIVEDPVDMIDSYRYLHGQ